MVLEIRRLLDAVDATVVVVNVAVAVAVAFVAVIIVDTGGIEAFHFEYY